MSSGQERNFRYSKVSLKGYISRLHAHTPKGENQCRLQVTVTLRKDTSFCLHTVENTSYVPPKRVPFLTLKFNILPLDSLLQLCILPAIVPAFLEEELFSSGRKFSSREGNKLDNNDGLERKAKTK